MRSLFRAALCAAALASFSGGGSLLAHDGHDHGAPPPAATSNLAPRTEAVSEHYELVAIARGGDLVIYLDRFATNESVDGASIAVETPAGPEPARAMANEPYRLSAPWSAKPGSYDLIFTVSQGRHRRCAGRDADHSAGRSGRKSRNGFAVGYRKRHSGAVVPQCPDRADGRARRFCRGNCRHDVDVATEPARDGPHPCRDARHVQSAPRAPMTAMSMARRQFEPDGARPGAAAARRRRIRAQEHPAHSRHPHRTNRIRPRIAPHSNCRAASFPIRTPADLFNRRSAAGFRRRRTAFRGWGRRSKKAMFSPI